jgi:hypothetical protein
VCTTMPSLFVEMVIFLFAQASDPSNLCFQVANSRWEPPHPTSNWSLWHPKLGLASPVLISALLSAQTREIGGLSGFPVCDNK